MKRPCLYIYIYMEVLTDIQLENQLIQNWETNIANTTISSTIDSQNFYFLKLLKDSGTVLLPGFKTSKVLGWIVPLCLQHWRYSSSWPMFPFSIQLWQLVASNCDSPQPSNIFLPYKLRMRKGIKYMFLNTNIHKSA